MKKIIMIVIILFSLLSCNEKKNIRALFDVEDSIDLALKSSDPDFVDSVVTQIEVMEVIYPEHQSLKEKKYTLEIRLRRYDDAIETIDSLLLLAPNDIDNRIIQGILLEINGDSIRSKEVLTAALNNLEAKMNSFVETHDKKRLGRSVNRVMILKLLYMDNPSDYSLIKNDPEISNNPEILQLLIILEKGDRELLINNYR